MPDVGFTNLLVVSVIALLAPLTLGFAPRLRVPAVVLEIVARRRGRPVRAWLGRGRPAGADRRLPRAGVPALPRRARDRPPATSWPAAAPRAARLRASRLVLGLAVGLGLDAAGWARQTRCSSRSRCRRPPSASSCRCSRTRAGSMAALGQTVVAALGRRLRRHRAALAVLLHVASPVPATRVALLAIFAVLVAPDRWSSSLRRASGRPAGRAPHPAARHHRRDPGAGRGRAAGRPSSRSPSGSGWRPSSAPSWPAPSSGWSTATLVAPAFPDQARGARLRLPDPGVLRGQRAAARP